MEPRNFICFRCKHWRIFELGCAAFPDGIPDQILLSNRHSRVLPNQDNKIVFEEGNRKEIIKKELNKYKQFESSEE